MRSIQHRAVLVVDQIKREANKTAENTKRHEQHLDAWDVALVVVVFRRDCEWEERQTDILRRIKAASTPALENSVWRAKECDRQSLSSLPEWM